tara:strand:- start:23 stop:484 length:462 start_codon:yes stop_codon:yes gene_type:complete
MICPKCTGMINQRAEFPRCIQCGWEDYSFNKNEMVIPRPTEFRGDVTVIPYRGTATIHRGVLLPVQHSPSENDRLLIYVPQCPYCKKNMKPIKISSKSTKSVYSTGRISHYNCHDGHVIYLETTKAVGLLGWLLPGDMIGRKLKKRKRVKLLS